MPRVRAIDHRGRSNGSYRDGSYTTFAVSEASYASDTAKVVYDPSRYDPSDLPLWSIARTRSIALRPEVVEGDERYE